jgi:hypothetical protein
MVSVSPNTWGPSFWQTIHYISLGYPDNPSMIDQKNYQKFFENLHTVLPCLKCSINYKDHLNEVPLTSKELVGPKSLFFWTVKLHNIVNKSLNKPLVSNDAALNMYTSADSTILKRMEIWLPRLCILANILMIFYFIYYVFIKKVSSTNRQYKPFKKS